MSRSLPGKFTHSLASRRFLRLGQVFIFLMVGISCITRAADNLIDHRLPLDTGGIYRAQHAVPIVLGVVTLAGALYEGSESRLGKTFWRSGEAMVFSGLLGEGLSRIAGRERPSQTDSPNNWFKGSRNDSFPSAHVAVTAAMVTPIILEYMNIAPWTLSLAALPVYEMVARVKAQKHWQTDVLAGAALGVAVGRFEQQNDNPLIVRLLPGGVFIGFNRSLP